MEISSDDTDPTLESIEFLARSKNRIAILNQLIDGRMERYEIEEATEISRPTVSRILEDFDARGWITSSGREYKLTQLGAYVTREFKDFLERMRVEGTLGEVAEWLPEEPLDFDLTCLTSAQVVRAHKTDATAPTTHIVRRLESADRLRVMTYTLLPEAFRVCAEKSVNGDLELEVVFDSETVATMASDERNVQQARDMLETGRVAFYLCERPVPYVLIIPDDEVILICLTGEGGVPRAVIDADHESARDWARSEFEKFRTASTPLELSLFAG